MVAGVNGPAELPVRLRVGDAPEATIGTLVADETTWPEELAELLRAAADAIIIAAENEAATAPEGQPADE